MAQVKSLLLDFFLISDSLQQMVENIEIIPGLRSDHSLVKLTVEIQAFERGPGFWKFNTMLLNDAEYVERINGLIEIQLAQHYETKAAQWEMLKYSVQMSMQQYSKSKKKR